MTGVECGSLLPLSKAAASRRTPNAAGPGKMADGPYARVMKCGSLLPLSKANGGVT